MQVIKAWKGATLAIGRVDAGLGRCGQVVAAVRVVKPGSLIAEGTFPILDLQAFAFTGHGDVVKKGLRMSGRKGIIQAAIGAH